MSKDFNTVVNHLQGNISDISSYLSNPEKFLSKYDLSAAERNALLSKDIDALTTLGVEDELVAGVMSSPWMHSQRCTIRP
ncbi:arginine deiminase [Marinilactibacillus sp. Marseille-P9653]|uniref:arginine deiminase n=1 Tax=Marinilactibacillus sp. Marseille-P9653 TaxID=2866583 RepID=UPI001CE47179|nr:arginine deiminase [Marinilactibacillus sp. Marseille-P9653]